MIDENVQILELAVYELGGLASELVFVGGATVGLYITDSAVPAVRATVDVDCVVEVARQSDYYEVEDRLRKMGFVNDMEQTCRFRKRALILDVMPTDENILGFSNIWYREGIAASTKVTLPSGAVISVFTTPYFIASKIEAFKHRGKQDYRASHDLEDIVAVIDGNENLVDEINGSSASVRSYLKKEFGVFLANSNFTESLEGHFADKKSSGARAKLALNKMNSIVNG